MSFHLRPLLAVALSAAMIAPALARGVGDVQAVTRSAFGTPPDAARAAKRLGDPVADHEWLETLSASGLKVRLADGSQLTLGADSKVLVDAFVYDPAHSDSDAAAKAAISLPLGFLRYVTGAMPKGHTVIDTPTATMTLRGTNVTVSVDASGETHLGVDEGLVTVRSKLTGQEITVGPGDHVIIDAAEMHKNDDHKPNGGNSGGNDQRRGDRDGGKPGGNGAANGSDSGSDSSDSSDGGSNGG